ncbi:PPR domain-containing protein/PPR_2 domain-containing protein/PPR_3 domain-containing protein [Cephalotus follicularis]|uniref:PPR domain-containing protein/PPR_2 domain-containing protein/PPR_3 domain-containing protein n=1 Tax=Cephalotus follicularis TaxID=3775 RepID=A0A1Q3CL75_CEPFO|nr:PPR domain-containing protein/PPR_2 domain-containing protein/PPR_3 domain-containing protein [Cephalotus follicularis]
MLCYCNTQFSMVRSSTLKHINRFLRKNRKWPLSPYKTKWHQTFSQEQALLTLKQAASTPPPPQQQKQDNLYQSRILSSLLHSFSLYNSNPTPNAYYFIIKTLTKTSQFCDINPILDHLELVENFQTPEYIFARLIKAYGDANKLHDAIEVFYRIPKFRCVPTVYSLNTLLSVLCRKNEGLKMVPHVLFQSQRMSVRLEESTFSVLINALCRIRRVYYAIEMLHCMKKDGFMIHTRMCSLIFQSLCAQNKSLATIDIMGFLEGLRKLGFCPVIGDYANLIRFLVESGRDLDALNVLTQMKSDGIKPDILCYTMVLSGVIANDNFVKADEVFDELLVLGLVPDVYTYNVYINGLCKQNNVEAGITLIRGMDGLGCKPNIITYNLVLEGLCKGGKLSRASELMTEMEMKGVGLNLLTYRIMINGLLSRGEIIEASCLLEKVLDKFSCLWSMNVDEVICGLCQRGMLCEALELIEKMADKNVYPGARVWKALLLSCGSNLSFTDTIFEDLVDPT